MAASDDDADSEPYADKIAERVHAFAALLATLSDIKDPDLRAEGMQMLQTLRETIKTPPRGQIARVK
ncbi:MAG: hypothetical protein ABSF67_20445 [Roseiarcus sp.]|jgi:hypothetical protein